MLRVLVVCTGNTCRSPMAEALLNARVHREGFANRVKVLSAGIAAFGEYPASGGAREAMKSRGIDLNAHRSRQLLPEFVQAADLVLTMTGAHKQRVRALAPAAEGKIYTLAEYAGEAGDVADPIGGSVAEYEACAAEIERMLDKVWQKIAILAGKSE